MVLLHGIGHVGLNMMAIEAFLHKQGYKTRNITYPSLLKDISNLSKWLATKLAKAKIWENASEVHFVVHSMGGLVTAQYLQDYKDQIPLEKMGRVVMLGTPNSGSEVADALKDNPLYKLFFGPAGQQLTTQSRKASKISPWYELGVIAGAPDHRINIGRFFIEQTHDGVVSVESTRVEGMRAHKVMPVSHSMMAWTPSVQKQVLHFLKEGVFQE